MLEIDRLSCAYGNLVALRGITINVLDGSIVAIIGRNGAGKSTLLRTISGLQHALAGEIRFDGIQISNLSPDRRVRMGLSHVPEGRQVFSDLTVEENLIVGGCTKRARLKTNLDKAYALFPQLAQRRSSEAGLLSGGQQQMLAVGRALMSEPRLLMLDEPTMGLAPQAAAQILATVKNLRNQGTTILLIEQKASAALEMADRAYVLEGGNIVLEGAGQELLNDRRVQSSYFGE